MQAIKKKFTISALFMMVLCMSISPTLALDPKPGIQDRYSSPSTDRVISPPSSGQNPVTKNQLTTDQKFNLVFSKMAAMEQTVATLQNQVTTQAQQIAQLKQVLSVHASGKVTIQSSQNLEIKAGGTVKVEAATVDLKAVLTGIHGLLKADTMVTTTVTAQSYTPGAGNIW